MKRLLTMFCCCFSLTTAFSQVFEFYTLKNSSGYECAETELKPIKVVESSEDKIVYGDISLANIENLIAISYIFCEPKGNRVDKIKKMPKKGKLVITLSNNEILTGEYYNLVECDHVYSRVAINSGAAMVFSSFKDLRKLSPKDHDNYICNQLSTYNITKLQINDTSFNFISPSEAKRQKNNAFVTAPVIKAMIAKIRP